MSSNYDSGPIPEAFAITPDASALAKPVRGFHVGVGGDVSVIMLDGSTVTFRNCISGMFYPYACTHVLSVNTTATNIIGLR